MRLRRGRRKTVPASIKRLYGQPELRIVFEDKPFTFSLDIIVMVKARASALVIAMHRISFGIEYITDI